MDRNVNSEATFERSSNLIVAEMDGDLVMMDVEQGSYFSINPVGAHVWTQLETPQTIADLTEGVQQAFKAEDASEIRADVTRFLSDLASHNLVTEVAR